MKNNNFKNENIIIENEIKYKKLFEEKENLKTLYDDFINKKGNIIISFLNIIIIIIIYYYYYYYYYLK
jgi:hypothetical protein